jgi:hypothetical protein
VKRRHHDESSSSHSLGSGESMSICAAAIEVFRDSSAQFIQYLHCLVRARDAYREATTASSELRIVLDASDHDMRALMIQMQRALNPRNNKPPRGEEASDTRKLTDPKPASEVRRPKGMFL